MSEIADADAMLRKVTVASGKTVEWQYRNGRWLVPGRAWDDVGYEPSIYKLASVNLERFYSNCGVSPAPDDNGAFAVPAQDIRQIKSVLKRDGAGRPIVGATFSIDVRASPSDCEGHAHAVVATDPGLAVTQNGRRQAWQSLQTALGLMAEGYVNGETEFPQCGWVRIPPGLVELREASVS